MTDSSQRFLFENTDVRGEFVQLAASYQDSLNHHNYPPQAAQLLGEFLAAATALGSTLKFDGTLTLQARGDGQIPLIMAETTSDNALRGICRFDGPVTASSFAELLGSGQLTLTIDPQVGARYQGIVALEEGSLANCIAAYFAKSEQLSTRLWLAADGRRAAALLLQELPPTRPTDVDLRQNQWDHLVALAETVSATELLALDAETLLHRLYHEEVVRLFTPRTLRFACSCSRERVGRALLALGRREIEDLLQTAGEIVSSCEFCGQQYSFDPQQVEQLFSH